MTLAGDRTDGHALADVVARLDAVLADLSTPPADRDPVLWAAHESVTAARTLLAARTGSDSSAPADLTDAAACVRSAVLAVRMAQRV